MNPMDRAVVGQSESAELGSAEAGSAEAESTL